jgi:Ni/Fe-hydrogenase subunit HybB-like protein
MTTLTTTPEKAQAVTLTRTAVALSLLALLTLAGVWAGLGRLLLGLGATTGLSDGYSWGIWIAFDFVLIAFAGAGFTMAAVTHVLRLHRFEPALRPAILTGLFGYMAVLLLLVLDLGRPDRFYNFILYWNLHSPLFEISCCILLYTIVLTLETAPFVLERLGRTQWVELAHKAISVIAIVGVTLSSLHQSTLGTLYLNMPHRLDSLWYSPALPVLFFVSSVMAGLSLALLAYTFSARILGRPTQPEILRGLAVGAGWVALVYALLKLGDLWLRGQGLALFSFDAMSQLLWLELGLGAIVPAVLLLTPSIRRQRLGQWLGLGLILFGVLLNRFNATMFAQTPPPGTPPYSPHPVEWLTTVGILAGAALAWYVAVRWLVIFEEKRPAQ